MTPSDKDDSEAPAAGQDAAGAARQEPPVETRIIVGIGSSAGGLPAMQSFLDVLPADTGLAFVVIQHMAAEHESMLADLMARRTDMPVAQAVEGTAVSADHVYVIPPDHDLSIDHGRLRLIAVERRHRHRLPIDFFFRALAADQGNRASGWCCRAPARTAPWG